MLFGWKIRLLFWGGFFLILAFLFWQAIVPTGEINYIKEFPEDNYFIKKLTPVDRVSTGESGAAVIQGDPVYFNLQTPRAFNRAEMEIVYRRAGSAAQEAEQLPVMQAGILADKDAWRYRLKPIENFYLDKLAGEWHKVGTGELVLLQRDPDFRSFDDFLDNQPPHNTIAVFRADIPFDYRVDDYTAAGSNREIPAKLRGGYELYTYIREENLDIAFSFLDLNQNPDEDPVRIQMIYKDQVIAEKRLADDGIADDSGEQSRAGTVEFSESGLPEGVYKVAVRANDDIVTDQLSYRQSKMSFIHSLRLYNASMENVSLYTNSPRVQAKTMHPAARQSIEFAGKELALAETYKQYEAAADATSTPYRLQLERDGITVSGSGVFAFQPDEFLDPRFRPVDRDFSFFADEIDYIVTSYKPSVPHDREWKKASLVFDLKSAHRHQGKHGFILSVPGLRAEDGIRDGVEIKSIQFRLEGKSLYDKVKEFVL